MGWVGSDCVDKVGQNGGQRTSRWRWEAHPEESRSDGGVV